MLSFFDRSMDSTDPVRLRRVEAKLDLILTHLGLEYREEVPDGILELLATGRKIEAIKLYRQHLGVGLKEAKDAVDAIARACGL